MVRGDALMAIQWETLADAARRTGYAYSTFKKWSSEGRLPFAVYGLPGDLRTKPEEVDRWLESTKRTPIAYMK